jgi:peptidoglycan/xylan/chitin deacetylase (PgdA/CDA1 family)
VKRVLLSFDNGPHLQATPELLRVLARRNLKATFFFVGTSLTLPGAREVAARIRGEGHRIGNHTLTHGAPLGRRPERGVAEREIGEMQDLLGDLAPQRIFRPNGEKGQLGPHLLSQDAVDYLRVHNYTAVTWNCVPQDWLSPPGSWVTRAYDAMAIQDWTAIVLHDHRMAGAMAFLEGFLDTLIERNYEFSDKFPPECVLIRDGQPTWALEGHYTPA